jgi:hypothetical protein
MTPLIEEANQLAVKIQDDTEELMLILDNEKKKRPPCV